MFTRLAVHADFFNSFRYHAFIKTDLRLSIKGYRRNGARNERLIDAPIGCYANPEPP
jgi:hypothetical protein